MKAIYYILSCNYDILYEAYRYIADGAGIFIVQM